MASSQLRGTSFITDFTALSAACECSEYTRATRTRFREQHVGVLGATASDCVRFRTDVVVLLLLGGGIADVGVRHQ